MHWPYHLQGTSPDRRGYPNPEIGVGGKTYEEIFVPSVSPSLLANFQRNLFYKTPEEYLFAVADALGEEYRTIVDAGCLVQIDDPGLLSYHMRNPDLSMADWRKWAAVQVEALNQALRGIPRKRYDITPAMASTWARAFTRWSSKTTSTSS